VPFSLERDGVMGGWSFEGVLFLSQVRWSLSRVRWSDGVQMECWHGICDGYPRRSRKSIMRGSFGVVRG
jgi:hypothetical protein